MTEEQINIAIASACGWQQTEKGWWYREDSGYLAFPPDYGHDLNAMHEAEMSLPIEGINGQGFDGSRSEFRGQLRLLCEQPYHAKARQRAEAFLRTLSRWEEGAEAFLRAFSRWEGA